MYSVDYSADTLLSPIGLSHVVFPICLQLLEMDRKSKFNKSSEPLGVFADEWNKVQREN